MKHWLKVARLLVGLSVTTVLGSCVLTLPQAPSNATFNGSCEQREEDGYYDNIRLKVTHNVVEQMEWTANPGGGFCQFNLKDFKQVKARPQVDLQSTKDRRCHVYIWENGQHITVSTQNCKSLCTQNDELLPILLNPRTNSCLQNVRR